jgi:hypothetical protein
MKRSRIAGIGVWLAVCALVPGRVAQAEEKPTKDGTWQSLFDGKTLAGWHHFGEGQWVVEDGAIVGRTQTGAKLYSLLVSDGVYRDFTVRLKFKSLKGNSGFYVRMVPEKPDKAHGLQIEVDPRKGTGGIYESYGRAWVVQPTADDLAKYFKLDDWNELTVAAYGGNVEVKVNGVTSAKIENDSSRPGGSLAVQMHAGNEMLVMFKDIEILAPPKAGPDQKAATKPEVVRAATNGSLRLSAKACRTVGPKLGYMPEWDALGWWTDQDRAEWDLDVARVGAYDVYLEWSAAEKSAGNPYVLEVGGQRLEGKVESTGSRDAYRREKIGQIQLQAGSQTLVFRPGGEFKTALLDLRELRLVPVRGK